MNERSEYSKYRHLDKENRVIYDRKRLELISVLEVKDAHPEWTEAKQKEIGYSEESIQDLIYRKTIGDIVDRMVEEDGGNEESDFRYNLSVAERIMENVQPELMPNIHEWIENRPLSKIKIHGWTVDKIMTQFGPSHHILFVEAIECMIYWKETNYRNKDFCRLYFTKR